MEQEERMVRFRIMEGPKWDPYRNHDGELMHFMVMKQVYESGGVFCPMLEEPVEVTICIDHVASPIHAKRQMILGKIVGEVPQGELLPEFKDDTGLLFLADGADVVVVCRFDDTDLRYGHITFEGEHASRNWQMTQEYNAGWISQLRSADERDDNRGLCHETVHFMQRP